MKKSQSKPGDNEKPPRRLILNRETLQVLDDSASLRMARGGSVGNTYNPSVTTTENTDC